VRTRTCHLQSEGKHITTNEQLREPALPNHGVRLAIHELDDTPKLHVDARREEGRRNQ